MRRLPKTPEPIRGTLPNTDQPRIPHSVYRDNNNDEPRDQKKRAHRPVAPRTVACVSFGVCLGSDGRSSVSPARVLERRMVVCGTAKKKKKKRKKKKKKKGDKLF